jgi:hypothetical protein
VNKIRRLITILALTLSLTVAPVAWSGTIYSTLGPG